jgi:hypothetical protein
LRSSVALVILLVVAPAYAFDDPGQFFVPPTLEHAATLGASAEGVYFTGAPRFTELDCSSCHTDTPGAVTLRLGADPADLFSAGYVPGATYQLEVALENEVAGLQYSSPTCTEPPLKPGDYPYVQCNNNSFALEIDGTSGPLAGAATFCAAPPLAGACPPTDDQNDEVVVAPGGDAAFANRAHDAQMARVVVRNGATTWRLWWTAPPAGSGPVTLYTAVVDGNGGEGSAEVDQDPVGDDTVRAVVAIQERSAPVPTGVAAGCSMERHRRGETAWLWLIALGLLSASVATRRARLRRRPPG